MRCLRIWAFPNVAIYGQKRTHVFPVPSVLASTAKRFMSDKARDAFVSFFFPPTFLLFLPRPTGDVCVCLPACFSRARKSPSYFSSLVLRSDPTRGGRGRRGNRERPPRLRALAALVPGKLHASSVSVVDTCHYLLIHFLAYLAFGIVCERGRWNFQFPS